MISGLTLFPVWFWSPKDLTETTIYCSDHLTFTPDNRIFNQFDIKIKTNLLPPQIWVNILNTFNDVGGDVITRKDKFGALLTYVYAKQLKKLKVAGNSSPKNKAIKAFIGALPDDTPIILYWR